MRMHRARQIQSALSDLDRANDLHDIAAAAADGEFEFVVNLGPEAVELLGDITTSRELFLDLIEVLIDGKLEELENLGVRT